MRSGLRNAHIGCVNDGRTPIRPASKRLRASYAAAGCGVRSVRKSQLSDGCTSVSVRIAMSAPKLELLQEKEFDRAIPVPPGLPAVPLSGSDVDAQSLGVALSLDFRVLVIRMPMCYSARILADYRRYLRDFGAQMSLKEFVDLFWRRAADPKLKIPKAMELAFDDPQTGPEAEIKTLIDRYNAEQGGKLEEELFRQRKRSADAQRSLEKKITRAALGSERIAKGKVDWALGKLSDLRRSEPVDEDSRIFPMHYAPVMIIENGRRTIKPMRYGCRLAGKPASYDTQFPGTYNARRDNLEGFWKGSFGVSHGLVVMDAFFENVNRHRAEGRELGKHEKVSNVILEFKPDSGRKMLVACLWSRWSAPGRAGPAVVCSHHG